MPNHKKDAIFFAHSFEKEKPNWSNVTDEDVALWFNKLLAKRWIVRSGKLAEARPISDKVIEQLNESKALISVFTRRYKVEGEEGKYLPSSWLLTECAYARGQFKHQDSHVVAGFREIGVSPDALGMLAANGMEFPEFDREKLEEGKHKFNQYLDDLESRIQHENHGQLLLNPDSYHQTSLHKIFLIYRNGYGTVQNIVDIAIKDADRFVEDSKRGIVHRLWTHFGDIPPLPEMLRVPVHKRKNDAFFHGMLGSRNGRRIETPLEVEETVRKESSCRFSIRFLDKTQQPLKVKTNDVLRYQYAWGIPNMFPVNEEDMPAASPNSIEPTYCIAELDANHGKIDNVTLELRFEREARERHQRVLFSKSPFVRFGRGPLKDTEWSQPSVAQAVTGNPDELDMWYERYLVTHKDLVQRMAIFWRPSSNKYQL